MNGETRTSGPGSIQRGSPTDANPRVTPDGDRVYSREQVTWLMAQALRWGYETRVDEENEAWPDTEIVFNAGETIRALDRKRYREACDAARPAHPYPGGPVDWDTGRPVDVVAGDNVFWLPVRPRFPTLDEQSAWLTPEDVAFCRRYAREHQ